MTLKKRRTKIAKSATKKPVFGAGAGVKQRENAQANPSDDSNSLTIIASPRPKFVDFGPLKPTPSPAPSLAGKKGRGKVGGRDVTISFEKDTFSMSGDINGTGTWEQSGDAIVMRGKTSKYRGMISGKSISGVRFFYDAKKELEEWKIQFDEQAGSIDGTAWLSQDKDQRIICSGGGKFEVRFNFGRKARFEGTWKQDGNTFTAEREGRRYDGVISGNRIKVSERFENRGNIMRTWYLKKSDARGGMTCRGNIRCRFLG